MKISSVEPYSIPDDLHWSLRGYRVRILGEYKPIDYPLEKWDNTLQIGDTVNLVVRRSFPWFGFKDELDGLSIKAKKVESLPQRIEPYFSIEYHWADYYAEADWNLRPDFEHPKSFEHKADGDGWVLGVGFNFFLNPNWLLNFNYDYQDWSTDNGTDKTFFSNGTTQKTQLNEVNWTSHTFSLGINYRF